MSPRRRGPFEGLLFADTFNYPDGNLIGRGSWGISEWSDPSPQVHSHAVRAVADTEVSASVLNVLTAAQFAGAVGGGWWMAFTMTPTAREAQWKDVEIWIGNGTVESVQLEVYWDTGTGPTQQTISFGDSVAGLTTVVRVVGDLTQSHRYALQYRAADASLRLYIDGVAAGAISGVDISGIADRRFELLQTMGAVAALPVITEVEVGLGTYPG